MGTEGGYVRRSRNDGRPNAGADDGDTSSRVISPIMGGHDPITADMITHGGTGRSYADGSGSWTALIDPRSATNTGAYAGGYTLGNQHPDLSMDGANTGDIVLTQEQIDCVVEFLNFSSADPSAYFADINPGQNPVLYTIVDTADAAAGETFYDDNCFGCHGDPATDHQGGNGGHPDVANVMLYLQELGGTGFAMTPGMTGTWWNGPERAGEGFPVEVGFQADGTMILWVTFFTYNNMGNQTWLTAQGTVTGTTIDVDVFMPKGPMWGMDFDPADVEPTPWGSGTFTFSSCSSGHMSLEPNDDMMGMMGFTDLDYDLMRFDEAVISGIDCPN
jgi:hypothetical protein